jgi:ABC-2 type transport system permease protein
MSGYRVLLPKELRELVRTHRLTALAAVLFLLGVGGMVALLFLPDILRLSGEVGDIAFPEQTIADALASYDGTVVQLGLVTLVLVGMGSVVREREHGAARLILAKPVSTAAYLGAKLTAYVLMGLAVVWVEGLIAWAYAAAFFPQPQVFTVSVGGVLGMLAAESLFITLVAVVTVASSALARSQLVAALQAFVTLVGLSTAAVVPLVGDHLPGAVTTWGVTAMRGLPAEPRWSAVAVTLAVMGVSIWWGWRRLRTSDV